VPSWFTLCVIIPVLGRGARRYPFAQVNGAAFIQTLFDMADDAPLGPVPAWPAYGTPPVLAGVYRHERTG